jgi:hypothetical protein
MKASKTMRVQVLSGNRRRKDKVSDRNIDTVHTIKPLNNKNN